MNSIRLRLVSVLLIFSISCGWLHKDIQIVKNDVIDCTKVEVALLKKPGSIIKLVAGISASILISIVSGATAVPAIIADLIVKYEPLLGAMAEQVIACVVNELRHPKPDVPADPNAPKKLKVEPPDPLEQIIEQYHWKFKDAKQTTHH